VSVGRCSGGDAVVGEPACAQQQVWFVGQLPGGKQCTWQQGGRFAYTAHCCSSMTSFSQGWGMGGLCNMT
jgi:hypothetical protein